MSAGEPRSRWLQWRQSKDAHAWGSCPEDMDMDRVMGLVRRLAPVFSGERAYFPTTVTGWHHLPETGCMLVGNHSGGTSIPDVWGLGVAWYQHFGIQRPLHALAHEMVFALEGTGRFFAQRGILRANRDNAARILSERQRDLLVLPGGDLDTWRPWTERYTVRFAGRKGYAVTAIRNQVPIVPVAHAGAHDTLVVLRDGRRLARALHFPELFRAHICPVHLSFPWGLAVGPMPHLPPPTALRYRFAAPVRPPTWKPGEEISEAMVDDFDRRVRHALQRELDVLRDESTSVLDRVEDTARRARGTVRALRRRFRAEAAVTHQEDWLMAAK